MRGELVRAIFVLAALRTNHIGGHRFVEENFKGGMVVEGAFGRKVGHNVFVMHNTVKTVNSGGDELSHGCISDSGATEVVNIHWNSKLLFQSQSSDLGKGSSQTVSCGNNSGSWVFFDKFLYLCINLSLDDSIILQESSMNFTSFAIVGDHFHIEVFNPILGIGRSSKRNNDLIFRLVITDKAGSKCDNITDMGQIYQSELFA